MKASTVIIEGIARPQRVLFTFYINDSLALPPVRHAWRFSRRFHLANAAIFGCTRKLLALARPDDERSRRCAASRTGIGAMGCGGAGRSPAEAGWRDPNPDAIHARLRRLADRPSRRIGLPDPPNGTFAGHRRARRWAACPKRCRIFSRDGARRPLAAHDRNGAFCRHQHAGTAKAHHPSATPAPYRHEIQLVLVVLASP